MLNFRFRSLAVCLACAWIGVVAIADEPPETQSKEQFQSKEQVRSAAETIAQATETQSADRLWTEQGWPLLQKFCLDCHNSDDQEADLDLSPLGDPGGSKAIDGSLKRVLEMVRFGAMPPEDVEQPTEAERKLMVSALDHKLYAASCEGPTRPGTVTARRLNRAEYNHSVRDLFGIDIEPASDFPSDEVGAGFDNNSDVLSLSPILMEKYIEAGEKIAEQLILDPSSWPKIEKIVTAEDLFVSGDAKLDTANGWFFAPGTFAWAEFDVPTSGSYRLSIRGGTAGQDDSPMSVAIYDQNGELRELSRLKYFGGGRKSSRSIKRIELNKGKQRLYFMPVTPAQQAGLIIGQSVSETFASVDDQVVADATARRQEEHERYKEIDAESYPFLIRQIDLRGPHQYLPNAFPETHNRVVVSEAEQVNNRWREVPESAARCLRPLLRKAFRGPVSDEEVKAYVNLVSAAVKRGDSYYQGLRVAVTGILVSPRFLFRIETPPEDFEPESDGSVRLTEHQLATRLSYFLWSSTPDEPLLDDADEGKLNGENIDFHIRRMLQDSRSDALATQFAAQWLGLRNLDQHEVDSDQYASFTRTLRESMKRETELLFMHMVRENRPIAELLTSDFTFVNNELATHYGIQGVPSEEFKQVSLVDLPRRGVLSHASVLTLTSNPQRTSPVKRGKWILENIFGTLLPTHLPGCLNLRKRRPPRRTRVFVNNWKCTAPVQLVPLAIE